MEQIMEGENGRIAEYEIYVSDDPNNWGHMQSLQELGTHSGRYENS